MDIVNIKKGGLYDKAFVFVIKRVLKKKLGIKPDLSIGFLQGYDEDGKVLVHLDVDGTMTKREYETLKSFIEKM